MSRKKAVRGKAATSSPSAGSPAGKGAGRAARSSPGIVQMNGVVHPSRPSVSSSSEFYDIAFKVRSCCQKKKKVGSLCVDGVMWTLHGFCSLYFGARTHCWKRTGQSCVWGLLLLPVLLLPCCRSFYNRPLFTEQLCQQAISEAGRRSPPCSSLQTSGVSCNWLNARCWVCTYGERLYPAARMCE